MAGFSEVSFREKSAWVSLVSNALVYGVYFAGLAAAWAAGGIDHATFVGRLIAAFVLLVILEIALHVAISVTATKDALTPRDERERLIELKATSIAYGVLAAGTVMSVGALMGGADAFVVMNLLFFALVLATVAKYGSEIVRFRFGA